ncbi:TRML2 protein, partial [Amazona guildingii]|nr:TRML2 protein [Amazona guildingii]
LRALLLLLLCFPGFEAQVPNTKETHSEGSSLYFQCPYRAGTTHQQQKAWCRLRGGRWEPLLETKGSHTNWAAKGRIALKDDPTERTVSVTMTELQAEDSGTYCCAYSSYGYHPLRTVSLFVFKVLAGTTLSGAAGTSQATPPANSPAPSSNGNTFILLSGVLSILFLLALISLVSLYVRRCKQLNRTAQSKRNREEEDTYEKPGVTAQPDNYERLESPRDNSKDLKYVTLNFKSQLSPEDPLYCNVELSEAHRKPKDDNVEYAIIAFKQLPTNDK